MYKPPQNDTGYSRRDILRDGLGLAVVTLVNPQRALAQTYEALTNPDPRLVRDHLRRQQFFCSGVTHYMEVYPEVDSEQEVQGEGLESRIGRNEPVTISGYISSALDKDKRLIASVKAKQGKELVASATAGTDGFYGLQFMPGKTTLEFSYPVSDSEKGHITYTVTLRIKDDTTLDVGLIPNDFDIVNHFNPACRVDGALIPYSTRRWSDDPNEALQVVELCMGPALGSGTELTTAQKDNLVSVIEGVLRPSLKMYDAGKDFKLVITDASPGFGTPFGTQGVLIVGFSDSNRGVPGAGTGGASLWYYPNSQKIKSGYAHSLTGLRSLDERITLEHEAVGHTLGQIEHSLREDSAMNRTAKVTFQEIDHQNNYIIYRKFWGNEGDETFDRNRLKTTK